ncbi:hypothetical protein EE612_033879, partial [Oryza sativa]
SNIIFFS